MFDIPTEEEYFAAKELPPQAKAALKFYYCAILAPTTFYIGLYLTKWIEAIFR
jgi:hypothetical protein